MELQEQIKITKNMFDVFKPQPNENSSTVIKHIYDINEPNELNKIVTGYVDGELPDGDHDLQRSGDQTNPLIEYCENNKGGKSSYINGTFVDFNYNYKGDCTSQSAIKKRMEDLLRGNEYGNRFSLEKTTVSLPKSLIDLQKHLVNNPIMNSFGTVQSTIVETHRGGDPSKCLVKNTHSTMYKSSLTTTFDLGSRPGLFHELHIGYIFENIDDLKTYKNEKQFEVKYNNNDIPLLRFYPNYFPNAFSIFIRKNEINEINDIFKIITPYFETKIPPVDIQKEAEKIKNLLDRLNRVEENDLLLLHMFYDKANEYTYSLQYGQVKADDVTMLLYGQKKRSIYGCFKAHQILQGNNITYFQPTNIIFDENMPYKMKCCHTLYGKTCGDGVTVEAANMFSYMNKNETTNVLSNDFCCNLRASYVTGFSTRQAPSSLAGTGLGSLAQNRYVEFFQSALVSGGKSIEEIYIENIINNFDGINFHSNDEYGIKIQLSRKLSSDLKKDNNDLQFLGYYVNKFIDKKMIDMDDILKHSAEFISLALNRKLDKNDVHHTDLFQKVGRFNFNTIKAEVDEYASSFGKIVLLFNNEFHKIFIMSRREDENEEDIKKNIENGISYVSSIEEKLKESNEENYKKVVFVFLTSYFTTIGDTKIIKYCNDIVTELNEILKYLKYMISKINGQTSQSVSDTNEVMDQDSSLSESETIVSVNEDSNDSYDITVLQSKSSGTNMSDFIEKMRKYCDNYINIRPDPNNEFPVSPLEKLNGLYKNLVNCYNDPNSGVFNIQSSNDLYPLKCQLKQRLQLLKFIVRYLLLQDNIKNPENKKLLKKQINTRSPIIDLNVKVKILNDVRYDKIVSDYPSPQKTPEKQLINCTDNDDIEEVLPPREDDDEPDEIPIKLSFFGNILSSVTNTFRNIFDTFTKNLNNKNDSNVMDTDNNQTEQNINDVTREVNNAVNEVVSDANVDISEIKYETSNEDISNAVNETKEEINQEKNKIIEMIRNIFRLDARKRGLDESNKEENITKSSDNGGLRRRKKQNTESTTNNQQTPYNLRSTVGKLKTEGGSSKKPAVTRRKNKKIFKRKTMKKRKIPKRKNKTRRLRQRK